MQDKLQDKLKSTSNIGGISVLSLFDGIACGRLALERAGIKVNSYSAYEINDFSISVSRKNYPDIKQFGDVVTADFKKHIGVDLLIGGSPCQGLSNANVYLKDGEYGVNGTGVSSLFWHYVRALKTTKPKYFLFENVRSMRNADKAIISEQLGCEPIEINSLLFSAQQRRRLYWTNIPFEIVTDRQTNDKLVDVLEPQVPNRYYLKEGTVGYILSNGTSGWRSGKRILNPEFGRPVVASCWKIHRADTDSYVTTDYQPEGRTNIRRLLPIECERLQTLPDNYTLVDNGMSLPQLDKCRWESIGNSWTANVVAHIFGGLNGDL